jgi:DNA-binding HxlR family transcriptional regulator
MLLSAPLIVAVLESLSEQPKALIDLRRETGSPPATTMRAHLRTLAETGIVTRIRRNDFPGSLDFELTRTGRGLEDVAGVIRSWLAAAPQGPIELGSSTAKSVIKALVEGWGTGIMRGLAARPLSLTQLNSLITGVSYPSLERRLGGLHLGGLIERTPGRGRGTPYAATEWLRLAIGPIAASARWERLYVAEETKPVGRIDIETAFLLAVPMLSLPPDHTGVSRLAVEVRNSNGGQMAGVMASVDAGRIASCSANLQGSADAWASGSARSWFDAVIDDDPAGLEMGGDCRLVRTILNELHSTLFVRQTA